MVDDARIAAMLEREAIRDVAMGYFDAVRRHDWPAVLGCFEPGAYADYAFEVDRTIEAQLELLVKGIRRFPHTTLMGCNCIITLAESAGTAASGTAGFGTATSETMALTAHESPPESGERTRLSAVRYDDAWVRDPDGRWRISRRVIDTVWRAWLDPRFDDRAGDHRYAEEW